MSVLGLRASSAEIRYAILEKDVKNNIIFKNRNGENRLKYPSTCNLLSDKIAWVKYELDRILRTNPDISKIVIKIKATPHNPITETTYNQINNNISE